MNSYYFGISGSWAVLIIISLALIAFSIWSYRKTVPEITPRRKTLLTVMRALALVLLLFALFEPVYTAIRGSMKEPVVVALLDNSLSMSLDDAGGDRKSGYKKSMEESALEQLGDDLIVRKFSNTVQESESFDFESLELDGSNTDLSNALGNINRSMSDENLRSIVIFTDGAFNSGDNPIYTAERLGKPVFVVGIGDSTYPKDVAIVNIITNDAVYINDKVPVNIRFDANGFEGKSVKVQFFEENIGIGETTIELTLNRTEYSVDFTYEPKTEGNKKLSIKLENLEGEITHKNNQIAKFVKVLKNKRIISFFSGSAVADISFIKNAIKNQEGIEIREFIQSLGTSFYNEPTQKDLNETEVFIFVNFPTANTSDATVQNLVNHISKGKSILFIAGRETDYNKLKKFEEFLPFNVASTRAKEFMVNVDLNPRALSNPLIRINGTDEDLNQWNNLPPIYKTETFVRIKSESELVASMKVNNVPIAEPLIMTREFQQTKSIAVMGYGLFRWKLAGHAVEVSRGRNEATDIFTLFFENSIRWLSLKDKAKQLIIKPSKQLYNVGERIEFVAQVYDASYQTVDNAIVELQIESLDETRTIIMSPINNGRYFGAMESLPAGDHVFKGTAKLGQNQLGKDDGRFTVGETPAEYLNLRMNTSLLRNLAYISGGEFFTPENANELLDAIQNHKNFKARPVTERSEFALWSQPWLLIIAILLFSIEWFVRKRSGML
ncbi:MAG: VWA domain-containing protein [Desulfobulbaceae bacterium]|nr:VWA domain-containing protein [Desulfobulbaceae bacterium]